MKPAHEEIEPPTETVDRATRALAALGAYKKSGQSFALQVGEVQAEAALASRLDHQGAEQAERPEEKVVVDDDFLASLDVSHGEAGGQTGPHKEAQGTATHQEEGAAVSQASQPQKPSFAAQINQMFKDLKNDE